MQHANMTFLKFILWLLHRLKELAKPIRREPMDKLQYNLGIFEVSQAAMKAKISPRLEELAKPRTY